MGRFLAAKEASSSMAMGGYSAFTPPLTLPKMCIMAHFRNSSKEIVPPPSLSMVLNSAALDSLRSASVLNMAAADGAKPYFRGATAAMSMSLSKPSASMTPLIVASASVKQRSKWK